MTSKTDTLVVISSERGFYKFPQVQGEDIRISYSLIGHQLVYKNVPLFGNTSFILMPNVVMIPQPSLIEHVNIVKTIPVVYLNDTIQYNMDAFSFRKNALLEEALKQLPGIQVSRDGSVYAHGRLISSVQVDGKKFFGGDVLTATRNLPADFIQKVQVIDFYGDMGEERGIKNEEPEKILNFVLREDRKRISFGQATAGIGTSERFIGSIGANRFNDGQEFSIVGSINNTNTSLFSFGSPSGAGERERSLFDAVDFVDPTDGLNNIKSLGFNFSDNLAERTSFNASYSFTRKENVTKGISRLQSNYIGNSISNEETYETQTQDNFHRLTAEFKHRFKNNDMLEVKPVFSYNRVGVDNIRERLVENIRITNDGYYRDSSYNSSPNMDLDVLYAKSFRKPGRKLLGHVALNFNNHDKEEDVRDTYRTIDERKTDPVISRFEQELFIRQKNGTNGVKANFSYVEPFLEHSLLEVTYNYELTDMSAMRLVEDRLQSRGTGFPHFVDSLNVNYNYRFHSSRAGLNYQYNPDKTFRANIGFAVQPLTLSGYLPREDMHYEYSNVNLVPTAGFKWRFSEEMDWSVDYVGKNNQPNFMHIIPVRDNSNSQNIVVGNPELKAEFSNRIATTLRKFVSSRGQYFETNFAYNFVLNKIVSDKKATGRSTIQETTFKNTSGYYDLKWYFLFNTPVFNESLQLDIVGNTDYYNNLSYVEDKQNTTRQFIYSQSLQLRYSWSDYFESAFNTNYMLNHARYTWPSVNKITAHSLLLSAGTKGYLGDYVTIGGEMSQRVNAGYESDFMNNSPTIINAYMEFSFNKNRLLMLRLQGFDLLDKNKDMGTYSEYIGNDMYEARNNRLGRYFMVTLNMRLQKYPKK
ncbi:outer membrane beta-barrel protein [Sphingobacterium wenxiniae]|nr:outer membrane beta-barrel protein [Sphingobacterium wenxiniae]